MNRRLPIIILFALILVGMAAEYFGQDVAPGSQQPSISLSLDTGKMDTLRRSDLLLIGALSFAPALLLATTSPNRCCSLAYALSRRGRSAPPTKVLVGLAFSHLLHWHLPC